MRSIWQLESRYTPALIEKNVFSDTREDPFDVQSFGPFSFLSKCLSLRLAIRIKERFLANTHNTITKPLTQAIIVKCRAVEDTAVIPDSYIQSSV